MVTRETPQQTQWPKAYLREKGPQPRSCSFPFPPLPLSIQKKKKNKLLQRSSSGPEGWIFINNKITLPKAQGHCPTGPPVIAHWTAGTLEVPRTPLHLAHTARGSHECLLSLLHVCSCLTPARNAPQLSYPSNEGTPPRAGLAGRLHLYASLQEDQISAYHGRHPDRVGKGPFPTRKETAEVVAETLITHIIPRFSLPTSIQSDNGPAFISRVVQQVSTSLGISWKLHIPYRPQSSGKVERANGLLKDHLKKLSLEICSSRPDLLPMALTRIRATPRSPTFLSPFELLYGRPFLLNHRLPPDPPPLDLIFHTCLYSGSCSGNTPTEPADQGSRGPPLQPGDSVLLKNLHPKALEPRWTGPHTVILTTPTAAKLLGDPSWHHLSRLKRTPEQHDFYKSLGNLHPPPPAYVWRFKVRETYDQDSTQVTRQRNPDRCNRDVNTYGGCRWSGCVIHDAYNEVRYGQDLQHQGLDPCDQRWVAGVMGKLYGVGWSSTPSGTIYIYREYVMAQEAQIQVSKSMLQAEHSLKGKLPDSPWVEVLSSWLQLIQHTLLFLNKTRTLPNVSHCFLCVSLQRPLLAAVPLMTPPGTQGHGECQPPLAGIPLWEPETPEPTLPPRICYQTSNPASQGTFFWCNGTLSNCINSSDPGPCFMVTVVPQLTLYGESELAWLLPHPTSRPARPPSSLSSPCLLKFIRSRIAEMSRVTVNQLLLHPYTRLPLNPPQPDPGL
ncbi:LOW QUALITY PROTEIN: hypothetical protein QTO34_012320 [Cnephaeus nilssonii]|uniref:Integrase catalytic domain-containing protein n=1 Tax=Cnephaeus nilssonii TaxID=3371016 RepID=A0AA40HDI5_CNENI|nr:LOW QUALITY PROTEIN: hypothetical protein QTO34_012320 [Eptesicus nilssonii]